MAGGGVSYSGRFAPVAGTREAVGGEGVGSREATVFSGFGA